MRTCSSANEVALGYTIFHTAHKSILLSLKNADLELHKWCGAVGHMILHLPANKSLLIPTKCGPAVVQMKWHWGLGSSTLPIILLSLKNADPELRKWCRAAGHMILLLPANKSLLIPKKCGPAVLQMKWHWGIGSSTLAVTLPISQFYYP